MADGINITVDDKAFRRAMQEVRRVRKAEIPKELFFQGRNLLSKIARITPIHKFTKKVPLYRYNEDQKRWYPARSKKTGKPIMVQKRSSGRAKAGWIPSWIALKGKNLPRNTMSAHSIHGDEGDFKDNTRRLTDPNLILINQVPYIEDLPEMEGNVRDAVALQTNQMEAFLLRRETRRFNKEFGI